MIPVLFKLGPITVYSYGLMMALGFLAADFVISSECRRRGLNTDFASSMVVWAAIAGIACSRLYSVIDNFPAYVHDPWSIIFSGSGFVWYGGLIGGLLSSYVVSRYYKINFLIAADMAGPALVIGQALGRIGCLLSGDGDWGMPTTLPWGMQFPNAIVGWNGNSVLQLDRQNHLVSGFYPGVHVHPTPIYEAILYTLIFMFLWSRRKETKVPGQVFYLYLMLAGAARFMVEFLRVNPRVAMGLSEAQVIAIVMMVIGSSLYVISARRPARDDRHSDQPTDQPRQELAKPAKAVRA
jgi:phosphatidylglycerol:prolipoprotein diacylglycerol transferase